MINAGMLLASSRRLIFGSPVSLPLIGSVCPPYGGSDPLGMFPLFLERTADVLAPRLSVVFRRLVRLGSFPACWRQGNVAHILKGPPSTSVANYRPISITSVLSKVFECLLSVRLGRFVERSGVLPTTQFSLSERSWYL